MNISGDWLHHPGTQGLCAALDGAGYRALFVGGAVRNAILGLAVADIDLATDARPETVVMLAEQAGYRATPTGIAHGTVTVLARGRAHEVTTFRRDVETFGRRATVAFSQRVEDDAARRDFTMNALYATAVGDVLDPLGGLPDLLARRLRFVGDPAQRITEDYLRILRFFRFHAIYADPAGGMDADGLAACASHADGVDTLSKERVGAEMRKLLAAADPAPAMAAMAACGVLAYVLPGAQTAALAPLIHLEPPLAPDWLCRLAVLGGADPAHALRLSRADARDLAVIHRGTALSDGPAALGWRFGGRLAQAIVLNRAALTGGPLSGGWQAEVDRGIATPCPVCAADLMPGLHGAALGARLQAVQARWLASDLRLSRAALLA